MDTIVLLNLLGMGMAALAFLWLLRRSALRQQQQDEANAPPACSPPPDATNHPPADPAVDSMNTADTPADAPAAPPQEK